MGSMLWQVVLLLGLLGCGRAYREDAAAKPEEHDAAGYDPPIDAGPDASVDAGQLLQNGGFEDASHWALDDDGWLQVGSASDPAWEGSLFLVLNFSGSATQQVEIPLGVTRVRLSGAYRVETAWDFAGDVTLSAYVDPGESRSILELGPGHEAEHTWTTFSVDLTTSSGPRTFGFSVTSTSGMGLIDLDGIALTGETGE